MGALLLLCASDRPRAKTLIKARLKEPPPTSESLPSHWLARVRTNGPLHFGERACAAVALSPATSAARAFAAATIDLGVGYSPMPAKVPPIAVGSVEPAELRNFHATRPRRSTLRDQVVCWCDANLAKVCDR
jgi:hypothetical protein